MLSPLDEVISECSNDSPMHPHLNMIQRNTRRLLKLVNTLLQVKLFFLSQSIKTNFFIS
jgi:hypothetical protein